MSFTRNLPSGGAAGSQSISGYKLKSVPNFTPQQMQLFQSLLGGLEPGLGKGLQHLSGLAGGESDTFDQLEAPYYAAFDRNLGSIASRFSQFGARDSSAFQNAVSGAGKDLAMDLGAQRTNLQHGAISKLLGLSENLLGQKPYENFFQPKKQGVDWGGLIGKIAPSLLALL